MRVMLESPFRADDVSIFSRNRDYLSRCLKDSISRGESPFASHAIYPQVLDDSLATERKRGIEMGYDWMEVADAVVIYADYGFSEGMTKARNRAKRLQKMVAIRKIGRNS